MKPQFRYYLRPPLNEGGYYQANTQGAVTIVPDPHALDFSPIEWEETEIVHTRNLKSFGVFRSLALSMTFVYDSAAILRSINYVRGSEGKAVFEVEQISTTTQLYEPFYTGAINFATAQDSRDTFDVGIEDNELASKLKAAEDTVFEIPILNSDSETILLDGIRLINNVRYSTLSIMQAAGVDARTSAPGLTRNRSESDVIFDVYDNVSFDTADFNTLSQNNRFYQCSLKGKVFVTFNGKYITRPTNIQNTNPYKFKLGVIRRRGSSLFITDLYVDNLSGVIKLHDINAGANIDVEVGDTLTLVAYVDSSNPDDRYYLDNQAGVFTVSYAFRLGSTTCKAYRYFTALQKLVGKISPGATVVSDYLTNPSLKDWDTVPYNAMLTCGDSIRRVKNSVGELIEPKIKVKFEDFRQDFFGRFTLGYGVEGNTLRVEPIAYFLNQNSTTLPDLGELNDLTVTPAKEFIHRDFVFGQKEQDYNDLNGRDEFNTSLTLSWGAIRTGSQSNHMYVFRSDLYGIEETRYVLEDKDTTDSESDNDVFCIEVSNTKVAGVWKLARPQNEPNNYITGVLAAETAYNLGYSPKLCFNRAASLVAVSLWGQPNATLFFQTTDKNFRLESKLNSGVLVKQSADVQAVNLPAPLFVPLISNFEVSTPVRLSKIVEANPYGLVYWRNNGVSQYGFVDEVGEKPATNAPYSFNIIMAKGSPVGPNNYPT